MGQQMERQPAPELALMGGSAGMVEVSADLRPDDLALRVWLTSGWALKFKDTGFWVRMAGADVFFAPCGVLFNRATFEATRVLQASDPTPRTPDAWLPRAAPRGSESPASP